MPRGVKKQVNYEAEIALIDDIINSHKKEIGQLTLQRQVLMSKMQHMDMDTVLEYIIKKGLSANEVLEILSESEKLK